MSTTSRFARVIGQARNRFLFAGQGYTFRNLNSSDGVAVFPKLGLAFNRIRKSANTSVTAFLTELERGVQIESAHDAKVESIRPYALSWADARRFPQFYSLVVVREPYARVLSAWLNKMEGDAPRGFRHFPGHGLTGPEGFEAFLAFLDQGGLHSKRHWTPQVDLMFQPAERFSRVARLERLADDMAGCLADIGLDPVLAQSLAQPHRLEVGTKKITGAANRLDGYYSAKGRAIVARLYRADFDTFGYPT